MQKKTYYAWCAGIVDGEGYVSLDKPCGIGRKYHRPSVTITNTDIRILEEIEKGFGGRILTDNRKNRATSKDCWKWYVIGSNLIPFLKSVIPFLVSKKEKAKIVLAYASDLGKKPINSNYRKKLLRQFTTLR